MNKEYYTKLVGEKLFLCSGNSKIMGQVSPQAKWVKEGMQFDRKDWQGVWENAKGEQSFHLWEVHLDDESCFLRIKFLDHSGKWL